MSALLPREALPTPAPTPSLHLRLVRQELPPPMRLTGRGVAQAVLQLMQRLPLKEALVVALRDRADAGGLNEEQVQRIAGIAHGLMFEGLRADDAITVALSEPAHLANKKPRPLPDAVKHLMFPAELTGENVVKHALELNSQGTKMDEAIVQALKKFSAPRAISADQAETVLKAAQALFAEGMRAAEAFNVALRKTLPKHSHAANE